MQTDFVYPIDLDSRSKSIYIKYYRPYDRLVYFYDCIINGNSKVSKIDEANDRNFTYAEISCMLKKLDTKPLFHHNNASFKGECSSNGLRSATNRYFFIIIFLFLIKDGKDCLL